ncbi:MAG TPA: iron-containing alcohol dehydrogenase, partial [Candidatus Faecousia intestinavium]|nr:iron-containing alcohol dehydrogenase [Candidatus Faecousia intestinavium]
MEEFSCKTKLICGSGAVSRLADFQAKRLFLVSDPFFVKNGTAQKIADGAKCSAVEIFDKIQPDPTVELAAEG